MEHSKPQPGEHSSFRPISTKKRGKESPALRQVNHQINQTRLQPELDALLGQYQKPDSELSLEIAVRYLAGGARENALKWFEESANLNNTIAMWFLWSQVDIENDIKWLRLACVLDDKEALEILGVRLLANSKTRSNSADLTDATKLLRRGFTLGNSDLRLYYIEALILGSAHEEIMANTEVFEGLGYWEKREVIIQILRKVRLAPWLTDWSLTLIPKYFESVDSQLAFEYGLAYERQKKPRIANEWMIRAANFENFDAISWLKRNKS